jgi:hypothetical protein
VPVHPYLVKSLLIHYHIIFSLILYTFKCAVVGKINNLSFFLSFFLMKRYRVSHNALPKKSPKNTVITIILSLWKYTELHT